MSSVTTVIGVLPGRAKTRAMSIIVIPTEAPKARSGKIRHSQRHDRSLRYASLRSAPVGTTGFTRVPLNPAYLKRYRKVTTPSAPRLLGVGERALREGQHLAANRAEAGLGLELGGIAERRVVEARQPDVHRLFLLGLGFFRCVEEFAGDALGIKFAHQHVALRIRYARLRGSLGAQFAQDNVDAPPAVVRGRQLIARRVAPHAGDEDGRERVERAYLLVVGNRVLGRGLPFRTVSLVQAAVRAILGEPGARLAADHERQRSAHGTRAPGREAAPGAVATLVAQGDG